MRRACDNQGCLGVTSQRFLKNSGQLAVSVRNVGRLSISQCINNFTQGGQTGIDLFGLIKCLPFGSSFAYFLASCQVNQIKSASFGTEIFKIVLTDGDYEKQMGSWGSFIHVGGCNRTVVPGLFDEFVDFFRGRDVNLCEVFNKHTPLFIRPDFQIWLIWVYQISQFLHVQLDQRHLNSELDVLSTGVNRVKHMVDHSWNDSRFCSDLVTDLTLHRMRLSRRRLSICEYRTVESFNHAVYDRLSCVIVHFLLFCVYVEDLVKREFQCVF